MRTVVAPVAREVEAQLDAMDPRLAEIARRYIQRLRVEPCLGHRLTRGPLGSQECRAVYFDRDSRPGDLFGSGRTSGRRGDQDPSEGPRRRVVYRLLEAVRADVRVVQVLAVGEAHAQPGREDVYTAAAQVLDRLDWRTR
jgi:hypothetical protein